MLHLPLRVMTWQCNHSIALKILYYDKEKTSFPILSYPALGLSDCQDEEEIAVTNPFLKRNPKDSLFDQALEAMQVSNAVVELFGVVPSFILFY